jgi:hypothetical protein
MSNLYLLKEKKLCLLLRLRVLVNSQSRSQMFIQRLTQLHFSRTLHFVYTLRMNILTCAPRKLDDAAEFQIVPTISIQISILYSINLSF